MSVKAFIGLVGGAAAARPLTARAADRASGPIHPARLFGGPPTSAQMSAFDPKRTSPSSHLSTSRQLA
jgi:hypothetical protein